MAADRAYSGSALNLRAVVPTDDGRLEVVARRSQDRWWVVARCRHWRGFGMGRELGAAVDAALGPYRDGVRLDGAERE